MGSNYPDGFTQAQHDRIFADAPECVCQLRNCHSTSFSFELFCDPANDGCGHKFILLAMEKDGQLLPEGCADHMQTVECPQCRAEFDWDDGGAVCVTCGTPAPEYCSVCEQWGCICPDDEYNPEDYL